MGSGNVSNQLSSPEELNSAAGGGSSNGRRSEPELFMHVTAARREILPH